MTKPDETPASPAWRNRFLCGDASDLAGALPDESIDCIVTSPPYFGHRKYSEKDDARELGRETSVDEYVGKLVSCFAALERPLKAGGTVWLNIGDTYRKGNLQGVPWRVALALQEAGWVLRSDIVWHKPNAMPHSVKNRPTPDHEYIFLFTRDPGKYYYDADSIREPHVTFSEKSRMKGGRNHLGKRNGTPETGKNGGNNNLHDGRWDQYFHPLGRNKRTVWSVPLGKFRGAHFAVFPEKLIEPCIKAGSPPGGIVLDPFSGAGTVAVVSRKLGREFVCFELIPEFVEIARCRLESEGQPSMDLGVAA